MVGALAITGDAGWPDRFWCRVCVTTLGIGIAHTTFSEYLKLPEIQHPTDHRYLLNHG
jgi:hypothetical protein